MLLQNSLYSNLVPGPVTTTTEGGATTTKIVVPATEEEKACKKNDIKVRTCFGGNEATKKTQKALLKQQYENFSATSSESLDSIFNRLQKLVSILAILGVVVPLEDLNLKFLKSLPAEWDTHVVVWMNKPDFDTMGLDDLYNNFKIVEQKIKKSAGSSNGDKNLAFVTSLGTSSTVNTNTAIPKVSTASRKVNTASTAITTATLSDATVYAFLASQPKGSQVFHEDLEKLHDDDLEEMDLKWNMALLSMRARKFYYRTDRKITIDGSNTAGFDKSKVECFNCHKLGHFARECRSPRSRSNNQEPTRKPVIIEDTSKKAMMALDGVGFDWSDMAEEQVQNNMALMAFSDSEVYSDKSCSKNCLKNHEALMKQYDDLLVKLNDSEFKTATYKRGLVTLENQIVTYKNNEVRFSEEVAVLKREVGSKEYELGVLRSELEKVKKEKDGIVFKIKGFDKSTKDLDAILESLDEFKEPELNRNGPRDSVLKPTTVCNKKSDNYEENTNDSLEKGQVSDNETSSVESPLQFDKDWKEKFFYLENHVESVKSKNKEKPVKRIVRAIHSWMIKEFDRGNVTFGGGAIGGRIYEIDFLGSRLISWQCKKQTIVATSTTEAEYVAAASCCGQVLWIQNQLLDYGCFLIFLLMADLEFCPKHNMVAFLEKPAGSEGFHQIIDFLSRNDGEVMITTNIDGQVKTITEASLRRHLKLEDLDGVETLPNIEIFEQLALMGYHTDSDSPKKTSWEQFSSNIATAVICLATNRRYNFSKLIFDHMVSNISSPHKFLMYPRFIKIFLDMQKKYLQPHTRTYPVPSLTTKVFSNMQRPNKGYSRVEVALFPDMINEPTPESSPTPSSSPLRITSSPLPSTEPSSEPPTTQPSHDVDAHVSTPHDSPLYAVYSYKSIEGSMQLSELTDLVTKLTSRVEVLEKGQQALETELQNTRQTYSAALTKLILKVKKLESRIKRGRARRRAIHVLLEEEIDSQDDSSKQGRNISDSEKDQDTVLINDNGVEWIQEEVEVQEKVSNDTEPVVQDDTPTEVFEDKGSGEKGEKEVSTAEIPDTIAELLVNTTREFRSTAGRIVYTRRTEQIIKDKGKAIMTEPEPVKKSKKLEEQERLGFEAAIRLQEQEDAEKRMQIAKDEEIASQ
ncbi:putative ribonuclease H-like domain-containing protein [Tanacetum coccineum]|uniref:Ribonuclease H-like domain-containing protein n=1 Tax=Tanacetum coccineum TaxID=301880 RepID=A0ABQ4X4X2_9ASTR